MAVLFVFIDGLGLGKQSDHNPLSVDPQEAFTYMAGNRPFTNGVSPVLKDQFLFKPVGARLGVKGLPQSGTGQATLFSGVNAADILGRHFGPYPHSEIMYLLERESLFHQAQELGKSCYFMNAYPDIFFERMNERSRWTCTTLMARSAGIELNREEDVREGRAITAEIINHIWKKRLGIELPEISPEIAADRMVAVAREKQVVLFEYFLTDKAGHAQDMDWAGEILTILNRFLMQLMDQLGEQDSLVISSDHGNLEDLSRKTHTLNKVPLFVKGPAARHFRKATSITDVTKGIISSLAAASG